MKTTIILQSDFGHDDFKERVAGIKEEIGRATSAENVAMGYTTADAVAIGWINSDSHKKI